LWLYALSPVLFLLAALLAASAARMELSPVADFALYSGLPPLGLSLVVLLVIVFNGFGEEIGRRGFALVPLQQRFGPVGGTFLLAVLWATWHTPTFFVVETYRAMTLPILVAGFGFGICAGSVVLSRVAQRTKAFLPLHCGTPRTT
jgi:uncharacterized protein